MISFYFQFLLVGPELNKYGPIRFNVEHLFRSCRLLRREGEQRSIQFFILCFWGSVRFISLEKLVLYSFFLLCNYVLFFFFNSIFLIQFQFFILIQFRVQF